MRSINLKNALLFALALPACGGSDLGPSGAAYDGTGAAGDSSGRLEQDLSIGSQGKEVRALHDFLTKYGYFPNEQLARSFPAWRPVVARAPENGDVYDQRTEDAVRAYQTNMGMTPTGVVNQETWQRTREPRCGFPDGMKTIDPTNKFALFSETWGTTSLTWSVFGATDEITVNAARTATANAVARWAAETNLSFSELSNTDSADIVINFADIVGGPHDTSLAFGQAPGSGVGGNITINSEYKWSTASPTPGDSFDYETVVQHELGHALGLDHSNGTAIMTPGVAPGTQTRAIFLDDTVAISTKYDSFTTLTGAAKDIGVGANGETWVIGTNTVGTSDFGIYKWNGSGWTASDGGAVRIAVGPSGVPWVINSAGQIFRRTTNSPSSGSWEQLPGLARDIGVGANGEAWVIGTTVVSGSDYTILKWNGSNSWVASDGGAVRIAVGPTGVPWVVNSAGGVYRRTTNSTSTGSWTGLTSATGALDIGISDGDYAWVIGSDSVTGGHPIRVWNSQTSAWVLGKGVAADNISVGPNGMPWIIGASNAILKPTK